MRWSLASEADPPEEARTPASMAASSPQGDAPDAHAIASSSPPPESPLSSSMTWGGRLVGNPNVFYTLCFQFMDGACYSTWAMQLLPLLIQQITSNNVMVGLSASTCGVAQLLGALVTGVLADRQPREHSIRAGAACALTALVLYLCAFWRSSISLILAAQTLWGLYIGAASTSVEALFADSVPNGRRTSVYNLKWILQTLCYVVGYGVAALFFFFVGNTWGPTRVRAAMTLGVMAHPLALVPLFWLRDRHALSEEGVDPVGTWPASPTAEGSGGDTQSHADTSLQVPLTPLVASPVTSANPCQPPKQGSVILATRLLLTEDDDFHAQTPAAVAATAMGLAEPADEQREGVAPSSAANTIVTDVLAVKQSLSTASMMPRRPPASSASSHIREEERVALSRGSSWPSRHSRVGWCVSVAAVPYWMSLVDLLLAIGSGMSLPYFPLFFADALAVSPAGLNIIYIASTLLTAATSSCLPWIITTCRLGRITTVLCVRLVGTIALALLAAAADSSPVSAVGPMLPHIVGLFLCRNALMNSVFGITRSVIMDCVTKHNRAKWSAMESVSTFSWAGSAVLGGVLTKRYGYQSNFFVTAVLQGAAAFLMIPAALGARTLDVASDRATEHAAMVVQPGDEEDNLDIGEAQP